jgi:hypothetical protein
MQHRLFFDVTELVVFDKGTGIQRVSRALLKALSLSAPSDWTVVAVRGDGQNGRFIAANLDANNRSIQQPKSLDEN